jgi:gamma-glutamylaminecyclotransferase
VQRYPLYLVGERCSPWMIDSPGEGHSIVGQVFDVNPSTLEAMDRLERIAEPDGYRRILIQARARDGADTRPTDVFAYLKPVDQFDASTAREGPLAEYTLAHAARYASRVAR